MRLSKIFQLIVILIINLFILIKGNMYLYNYLDKGYIIGSHKTELICILIGVYDVFFIILSIVFIFYAIIIPVGEPTGIVILDNLFYQSIKISKKTDNLMKFLNLKRKENIIEEELQKLYQKWFKV